MAAILDNIQGADLRIMSVTFNPELVRHVIGHLKENPDPLDVLGELSEDQFAIIKATWAIGSGIRHVGKWDEAVQYHIPAKGHRSDAEYMAVHDLFKCLRVGLGKLINS